MPCSPRGCCFVQVFYSSLPWQSGSAQAGASLIISVAAGGLENFLAHEKIFHEAGWKDY